MARVLFITCWYPTRQNPVYGVFVHEHARAAALFNDVSLLFVQGVHTDSNAPYQIQSWQEDRYTAYRLTYARPFVPKTSWLRKLIGIHKVIRMLEESGQKPEILHAQVYGTADIAVLFGRYLHIPVILTEHASSYPRNLLTRNEACWVRFWLNRVKLILPVSEDLGRHIRRYGINTPLQVVPNVVDTTIFHGNDPDSGQDHQTNRILVVARLSPEKGLDDLLHAVALVKQKQANFHVDIVGDGPQRDILQSLAEQLGLVNWVTFHGYRSKVEISTMMRSSAFLALTSHWENQPVVLLEAMACGLPVIAPRVGGIPEVVPPDCGLLHTPGDVNEIAANLLKMLATLPDYSRSEISRYARQRFSMEAVGLQLSQIYQQALAENDSRHGQPSL